MTNDDGDVDDEEVVNELREKDIVDQRALLHLKLVSDAATFRTWKNGFKVQLSKLDTSGQGLVLAWIFRGFDADKADLQDSGLLPRDVASLANHPRVESCCLSFRGIMTWTV